MSDPSRRDDPPGDLPASRPLGELIARFTAEGRLRGTRLDGRAAGSAALADVAVTSVTHDSRTVADGALFVAVPGEHADGHDFAAAAADRGAAAADRGAATPRRGRRAGRRGRVPPGPRQRRGVVVRRSVA